METALDVAFITYDLAVIADEGLNWANGLALAADIGGAALPFVTGGGAAVRAVSSRFKGQVGEFLGEATVRLRGNSVVGRQVTLDTGAARTRIDLLADTPTGLSCVECKFGPSAGLTKNQRLAFPEIEAGGAIPRGRNAADAGLVVGQPLGPTSVEVLRFNQTQYPSVAGAGAAFNAARRVYEKP